MTDLDLSQIKALTFDVGGTVFDWRGTIEAEVRELAKQKGADSLDVTQFATDWRRGMFARLARVRSRELPWMNADELHRRVLDDVLDGLISAKTAERDYGVVIVVGSHVDVAATESGRAVRRIRAP